jgi:hypothetical protein
MREPCCARKWVKASTNLLALMPHCERGDEYLVGIDARTCKFERRSGTREQCADRDRYRHGDEAGASSVR